MPIQLSLGVKERVHFTGIRIRSLERLLLTWCYWFVQFQVLQFIVHHFVVLVIVHESHWRRWLLLLDVVDFVDWQGRNAGWARIGAEVNQISGHSGLLWRGLKGRLRWVFRIFVVWRDVIFAIACLSRQYWRNCEYLLSDGFGVFSVTVTDHISNISSQFNHPT